MSQKSNTAGLTLMQIPGKRYRKPAASGQPDKRRKIGRPRREVAEKIILAAMEAKKQRKRSDELAGKEQKGLSLETLPNELLQEIFFEAGNYNLPMASRTLRHRFSNEWMYVEAIKRVLGPSWGCGGGDGAQQLKLLACRWVTVPLLQKAVNAWLKENMAKIRSSGFEETLRHSVVFLKKYPEYKDTKVWPEEPELLERVEDDRWNHDYNKMIEISKPFRNQDCRDPQLVRPSFLEAGAENDGGVPVWSLADNCRLPKHTLQGPWTEDKVKYLCWLVRAGATIDYHNSTLGEVAKQGLVDAILEGNFQAIYLLTCLGIQEVLHDDILETLGRTKAKDEVYAAGPDIDEDERGNGEAAAAVEEETAMIIVRILDILEMKERPNGGKWQSRVADICDMRKKNGLLKDSSRELFEDVVHEVGEKAYDNSRGGRDWWTRRPTPFTPWEWEGN